MLICSKCSRRGTSSRRYLAPVAMTTELAVTALPSSSRTVVRGRRPGRWTGLGRYGEPGTELPGLDHRPVGKLSAGDARGETEVVLDPGGGAGLAAGGHAVQHQRSRPSEAPYTAADSPAGPDPTTSRSQPPSRRARAGRPIAAASSALLGLRSSRAVTITIGVSSGATPSWLSRASAPDRSPDPATGTAAGCGPRIPQPPGVRRVPGAHDPHARRRARSGSSGG